MRIIDSHVHLYPDEINADPAGWAARNREAHWALLCTRRRKNGSAVQTFPSVAELLRQMDTDGIARAVLLGWYWEHAESALRQNSFFRDCIRAHPDRLSACATWHPHLPAEPFAQEARAAGFVGLGELSPHAQSDLRLPAERAKWEELFAAAGRHSLPVNLHLTEPASGPYPGKIETPLRDFVGWAEAFPATRFVWAHWGARVPLHPELGPRARCLGNVYYDTAASPLIYREIKIWREMINAVGAERVLFGSDFPLALYPRENATPDFAGLVREARSPEVALSAGELEVVLAKSAHELWRL